MSAHVIGRSPNSLAFGVPLIACARRAAAKPGLGGLVHFFPYNPLRPRFPDRHASLSIKHNKHRFAVELCPGLRILDRVPGPVLRDSDWPGPGTRRVGGPGYPGTRIGIKSFSILVGRYRFSSVPKFREMLEVRPEWVPD